ncbi:MAG TPA: Crp/Fnr family transcriptional regulator [Caulobacteraceae bacterium]|nr:Crp/Fnr family transcriptional regulator [Caulobacteraceae bacterium]
MDQTVGMVPKAGLPERVLAALSRNPVFAVLSRERRERLSARGTLVRLAPGGPLFVTGDEADAAFVILVGDVEIVSPAGDGRDVCLATLGPGALVGEMGVLDGGARSADVRALSRVELWRIGRAAVIEILREEPSAAMELLALLARRLRTTDVLVRETALLDLGSRLAGLLLERERGAVALAQGEMARLIGASREGVNRKLAAWRGEGWIDIGPFGVKLLDRAALSASVCRGFPL